MSDKCLMQDFPWDSPVILKSRDGADGFAITDEVAAVAAEVSPEAIAHMGEEAAKWRIRAVYTREYDYPATAYEGFEETVAPEVSSWMVKDGELAGFLVKWSMIHDRGRAETGPYYGVLFLDGETLGCLSGKDSFDYGDSGYYGDDYFEIALIPAE